MLAQLHGVLLTQNTVCIHLVVARTQTRSPGVREKGGAGSQGQRGHFQITSGTTTSGALSEPETGWWEAMGLKVFRTIPALQEALSLPGVRDPCRSIVANTVYKENDFFISVDQMAFPLTPLLLHSFSQSRCCFPDNQSPERLWGLPQATQQPGAEPGT